MATSKSTEIIFGGLIEEYRVTFEGATSKENVDEIAQEVTNNLVNRYNSAIINLIRIAKTHNL
jgi:hypothetical protein